MGKPGQSQRIRYKDLMKTNDLAGPTLSWWNRNGCTMITLLPPILTPVRARVKHAAPAFLNGAFRQKRRRFDE